MAFKIHLLADVQTNKIGDNTFVWQFTVILSGAEIGSNCNINCNCFIENDVIIGDNVTVKSGVQIWDGITIDDNTFIGPNVTFTNDLFPRSKSKLWKLTKTKICEGASIGANSTIIAGVTVGIHSLIGAGSVLTKSVPPYTIWYGNPAKHKGFITSDGNKLNLSLYDEENNVQYKLNNQVPVKND